jgi:hypothetical protein
MCNPLSGAALLSLCACRHWAWCSTSLADHPRQQTSRPSIGGDQCTRTPAVKANMSRFSTCATQHIGVALLRCYMLVSQTPRGFKPATREAPASKPQPKHGARRRQRRTVAKSRGYVAATRGDSRYHPRSPVGARHAARCSAGERRAPAPSSAGSAPHRCKAQRLYR